MSRMKIAQICKNLGSQNSRERLEEKGNKLFEPPLPLKIASRPVSCIAATIADGGAISD